MFSASGCYLKAPCGSSGHAMENFPYTKSWMLRTENSCVLTSLIFKIRILWLIEYPEFESVIVFSWSSSQGSQVLRKVPNIALRVIKHVKHFTVADFNLLLGPDTFKKLLIPVHAWVNVYAHIVHTPSLSHTHSPVYPGECIPIFYTSWRVINPLLKLIDSPKVENFYRY